MNDAERSALKAEQDLLLGIAATTFGNRFEEDETRGTRDPMTGRFVKHTDYGPDDQLAVSFSTIAVMSKRDSYLAGYTKYIDADFITIIVPGNRDLTYHGPVTDFYEWRFPNEYKAFKAGQSAALIGTPLHLWAEMTPSLIKELEYHGIRTVEQIANLSDSTSGVLRSFHKMKDRANNFLNQSKDTAHASLLQQQMTEQQTTHKAEMDELKAQVAAFMEAAQKTVIADEPKVKKGAAQDK